MNYPEAYQNSYSGSGDDYRPLLNSAGLSDFEILSADYQEGDQNWEYEHVYSPFGRLYFAEHNRNFVIHENQKYFLDSGIILMIPEDIHFHCKSEGYPEHLWIHFKDNRWNRLRQTRPIQIKLNDITQRLARRLASLHREKNSSSLKRYYMAKALANLLASDLPSQEGKPPPSRFTEVLKYIHANLGRNLKSERLSEVSGYSTGYLSALFVQYCKQSPKSYIRDLRMREAARKLAHTNDSIDAIASELGFANRHHFSRLFKDYMNEPPAGFRKRICV